MGYGKENKAEPEAVLSDYSINSRTKHDKKKKTCLKA